MRFYKNLYKGDSIKNVESVKWKLKHGAGQLDIYLITLSMGEEDQLNIFHNAMLKQKIFRKIDYQVVGIAKGREEAMNLVKQITDDCLKETGTANIKEYLSAHF